MKNLFEQLKKGYEHERAATPDLETLQDLKLYAAQIDPVNALDSAAVAYKAGRLQALFGKALEMRKPVAADQFDPDETAAAEEWEALAAQNFAIVWRNAVYLQSVGK